MPFFIVLLLVTVHAAVSRPTPAQLAAWQADLYGQHTIMIFPDQAALDLLTRALDPDLRRELNQNAVGHLPWGQFRRASPFFEVPRPDGNIRYVTISEDLWDRLPSDFLRRAYALQLKHQWSYGLYLNGPVSRWWIPAPIRARNLKNHLAPLTNDAVARVALERVTIRWQGREATPVVPATWRFLTESLRRRFVESSLDETQTESLPLNSGLTSAWARAKLGTFECTSGPNCFGIVLNLDAHPATPGRHVLQTELVDYLLEHFVQLDDGDPPRAGDVLVYDANLTGEDLDLQHVAIHVAPGVVFTKNGLSQFSPYVLQDPDQNILTYGKPEDFDLTRWRRRTHCGRALESSAGTNISE